MSVQEDSMMIMCLLTIDMTRIGPPEDERGSDHEDELDGCE